MYAVNVLLSTGRDRNLSAISLSSIILVMDAMRVAFAYVHSIIDFRFINICQVALLIIDERLVVNILSHNYVKVEGCVFKSIFFCFAACSSSRFLNKG